MPIRWALVSMREITSMPSNVLKLSDQTEIPISRGKREEIKNTFADFRWAHIPSLILRFVPFKEMVTRKQRKYLWEIYIAGLLAVLFCGWQKRMGYR